ncbi:hypothetical protein [Novipirellula artificiosorum]|uniref:Putative subtilase-type serine protease n=1 Tax=Novipirellula artificiosorum TaxID=2528016 RepID=A0A5C6DMD0_9BACT|nr:hypothetical protein [Novipirellula artificiosorum]TWU37325.1 putative subtilase-type serine protease precursor [Novipirellula artificiosorum]
MNVFKRFCCAGVIALLGSAGLSGLPALAQSGAYIGYAYPAGGQQGTSFEVKLGGQRLDGVHQVLVTGSGVTAKINRFFRTISNQELVLLREQLKELKQRAKLANRRTLSGGISKTEQTILDNIETRMAEYCNRPASASIASLVYLQVTVAADAEPGPREIRLVGSRGISNPLVFHVGQLPEQTRTPMRISTLQVLGKEELSLRSRPEQEVEAEIELPCTVNGQIASGEVNWYRFQARKGQRLVLSCAGRELIPYIADAVPGWFQPVLAVEDANGNQVGYNDDFRFHPDPALLFEVPEDGEYRFCIHDAIYRGREDFVYRVTIGEVPYLTSLFPLGGTANDVSSVEMNGWNLDSASLKIVDRQTGALAAIRGGIVSNRMPYDLVNRSESQRRERHEREPNNHQLEAEPLELPVILNGRIDAPNDNDVFSVQAQAGDKLVAEVVARRLGTPLDSVLKVTDESGTLLAMNDDHHDVGSGRNTHHADAFLVAEIPADGRYFVHLGDTTCSGGEAYAYRLRLHPQQPDFELRTEPSGAAFRSKGGFSINVYAIRKEGYDGEIRVRLDDSTKGFMSSTAVLKPGKDTAKLWLKTTLKTTVEPVTLSVQGVAMIDGNRVVRSAVPSDDRMQAFLWRHLVPAQDFVAVVFNPAAQMTMQRADPSPRAVAAATTKPAAQAVTFNKKQVAGRLRQLKLLYDEWLLTEPFYAAKVAECESIQ